MPGGPMLSGHQPSFHHPGILAKRLLIDRRAAEAGTDCAWLVADQDVNEPGLIGFPDLDEDGELIRRTWRAVPPRPGIPTCLRPIGPITPPPRVSDRLPASIQNGLDAMHQALVESPGELVSERFAEANERLFAEWRTAPCRLVHASELFRGSQGRMILERIVDDPIGCARSWNEAVRIVPRSARALHVDERDPDATEVPVWTVDPESLERRPGTLRDLRAALAEGRPILPRAFLMTAMIRSDGFETMVHGTGGGRYEPVTDHWARSFLGMELPPIEVATATVRLPLEPWLPAATETPTPEEIRRLEHDPWPSPEHKQALVARINAAEHGSSERQRRYVEMQTERTREQSVIAGRLEAMRTRFEATAGIRRRQAIGEDRTWAWPLHDPSTLAIALSSAG